ncbi:hypothetical protein BD324DRAFT_640158 [Kockovaella imperatae]|uniref:Uncharacterized protein n=1 Tax=Kockovaella imperatae TaxID=4999 RepID=A0A1Y1U746_9TREE|nr:hypothetical protein BD324DRAFT_640158 [Kockovaella imperatae]ORX33317.1 hypothetical protein BD324DRAFT_640158 [Kockovaella imperatae]
MTRCRKCLSSTIDQFLHPSTVAGRPMNFRAQNTSHVLRQSSFLHDVDQSHHKPMAGHGSLS